jgi:hypothetical protein
MLRQAGTVPVFNILQLFSLYTALNHEKMCHVLLNLGKSTLKNSLNIHTCRTACPLANPLGAFLLKQEIDRDRSFRVEGLR